MRIIRYLKGHIGALVLIIALLVVQAFADLSLPRYTSDLVDVGIQQGGIDRPSPSEFTADTFEAVCMLASPDEENVIRSSYDEVSDGSYAINEKGLDNRDELDETLAKPFAEVHFARSESAQQRDGSAEGEDASVGEQRVSDAHGEGPYDFDALLDAYRPSRTRRFRRFPPHPSLREEPTTSSRYRWFLWSCCAWFSMRPSSPWAACSWCRAQISP